MMLFLLIFLPCEAGVPRVVYPPCSGHPSLSPRLLLLRSAQSEPLTTQPSPTGSFPSVHSEQGRSMGKIFFTVHEQNSTNAPTYHCHYTCAWLTVSSKNSHLITEYSSLRDVRCVIMGMRTARAWAQTRLWAEQVAGVTRWRVRR